MSSEIDTLKRSLTAAEQRAEAAEQALELMQAEAATVETLGEECAAGIGPAIVSGLTASILQDAMDMEKWKARAEAAEAELTRLRKAAANWGPDETELSVLRREEHRRLVDRAERAEGLRVHDLAIIAALEKDRDEWRDRCMEAQADAGAAREERDRWHKIAAERQRRQEAEAEAAVLRAALANHNQSSQTSAAAHQKEEALSGTPRAAAFLEAVHTYMERVESHVPYGHDRWIDEAAQAVREFVGDGKP